MHSPDFFPFVDLSVHDVDEQDILDSALQRMQLALPEWQPREGNTEVMLLEAMAAMVAESVYAINRVPAAVLQVLLKYFNVERDYGALPTCTVTFHMNSDVGFTVPAGTRFAVPTTGDPIVFETDLDLEIFIGDTSGTISATGLDYSDMANGVIVGTQVDILDAIIYADYAVLASNVTGGRAAESDEEYYERGLNRFARLTETLVLPSHFTAYALEQSGIVRATTLDNYDPANDPDNNGPVGNDAGHVTVAVRGNGENLSTEDKALLQAEMDANSQANLTVHVIDPTVTIVNVSATVMAQPGWIPSDVMSNVTTALRDYLNPDTWGWANFIRYTELISLIDRVEGVDHVVSLSQPATALVNGEYVLALNGVASLAELGTATIVVNVP